VQTACFKAGSVKEFSFTSSGLREGTLCDVRKPSRDVVACSIIHARKNLACLRAYIYLICDMRARPKSPARVKSVKACAFRPFAFIRKRDTAPFAADAGAPGQQEGEGEVLRIELKSDLDQKQHSFRAMSIIPSKAPDIVIGACLRYIRRPPPALRWPSGGEKLPELNDRQREDPEGGKGGFDPFAIRSPCDRFSKGGAYTAALN